MRFIRNFIAGLMLSSCTPNLDYLLGHDAGHQQTDAGSDRQGDVDGDSGPNVRYDAHSDTKRSDLGRDSYHPDAISDVRADSSPPYDGGIDAPLDEGIGNDAFPDAGSDFQPDSGRDSTLQPDARVPAPDGSLADRYVSDAYGLLDAGLADVGSLDGNFCLGEAPFNSNQAGVCRGSLQSCNNGTWQDNYAVVSGYERNEISCDGFDNNCDGQVDENLGTRFYRDSDVDSHGNPLESIVACSLQAGYVVDSTDCDDTFATVYTGAPELCDGLNNDCDARIDEDLISSSRTCSAGVGECRRDGLEYLTCLGSAGWSTTYSGCDAITGIPTAEVCNTLDDNCNGVTDEVILDDFNRADQNGLGNNELGNAWINYGTADDWDVEGNAAVTTWRGGPLTNPQASSYVGHRNTFNLLVKFNLDSVTQIGGGGLPRLGVNCSEGSLDGFLAKIAVGGNRQIIVRDGVDLGEASFPLQANTDYLMRFAYDGTDLTLKLWQDGTVEPVAVLLRRPTIDVSLTREYLTISGDLDGGQENTVIIDYIYDHCPN